MTQSVVQECFSGTSHANNEEGFFPISQERFENAVEGKSLFIVQQWQHVLELFFFPSRFKAKVILQQQIRKKTVPIMAQTSHPDVLHSLVGTEQEDTFNEVETVVEDDIF